MYKQFFGLTRNPFEISPDPFFYHPTPRHNEALANLHYGVGRRKGFFLLTGEGGTGKTFLVRCLRRSCARTTSLSATFSIPCCRWWSSSSTSWPTWGCPTRGAPRPRCCLI